MSLSSSLRGGRALLFAWILAAGCAHRAAGPDAPAAVPSAQAAPAPQPAAQTPPATPVPQPAAQAPAAAPATPRAESVPGFLHVENISIGDPDTGGFNEGRPHVVSIRLQLPRGSEALRDAFVARLAALGVVDQYVFEWFGEDVPTKLCIDIGARVPVPVVQAALAVFAADAGVPVFLRLRRKEDEFLGTRRIYVGALVSCGRPLDAAELPDLLAPQPAAAFHRRLGGG